MRITAHAAVALAITMTVLLAGCTGAKDDGNKDAGDAREGVITASPLEEERTAVLDSGEHLAERIVRVDGTISITRVGLHLSALEGDVEVRPSPKGEWSMYVRLAARGATPEEAAARLATMNLTWGIEDDKKTKWLMRGLVLDNRPFMDRPPIPGRSTSILIEVPADVFFSAGITVARGNVSVTGLRFESIQISTGIGNINADLVEAGGTNLAAKQGDVDATVRISQSTRINAQVDSGAVYVRVPQGIQHGYDAQVAATNGDARVEHSDGATVPGDAPPGSELLQYKTEDYDARVIRTKVTLQSKNGSAVLGVA